MVITNVHFMREISHHSFLPLFIPSLSCNITKYESGNERKIGSDSPLAKKLFFTYLLKKNHIC